MVTELCSNTRNFGVCKYWYGFGQEKIITCWIGKEIKNEGYKIYPDCRGWEELSLTVSIFIRCPGAYLNNLQEERGGGHPCY